MNVQAPSNPRGGLKRLTNNHQCVLAITDSLNSSGQVLGLVNLAISHQRTKIGDIPKVLRREVMLTDHSNLGFRLLDARQTFAKQSRLRVLCEQSGLVIEAAWANFLSGANKPGQWLWGRIQSGSKQRNLTSVEIEEN